MRPWTPEWHRFRTSPIFRLLHLRRGPASAERQAVMAPLRFNSGHSVTVSGNDVRHRRGGTLEGPCNAELVVTGAHDVDDIVFVTRLNNETKCNETHGSFAVHAA